MPVLKNPQHELFAQAIANGANGVEAIVKAGYDSTANAAKVSANRLLKRREIASRINELLERKAAIDVCATAKAVEKLAITKEGVLRELVKLGFSNALDYGRVERGEFVFDLSNMTRDQAAAIQEITTEVYMEGEGDDARPVKRTKVKYYDKKAALVEIGKELGMFIKKVEVGGPGDFADKSDEELMDMEADLAERLEAVGATHSGPGSVN